jgi:16S rRNA (cytosine1402-N4)-methyltransferase
VSSSTPSGEVRPNVAEPREPETPGDAVHRPVLLAEVLEALDPRPCRVIVDGTVGAGGHAAELARRVAPDGRVLGLDRDPDMLALAAEATRGLPVTLVHSPYSRTAEVLEEQGLGPVDGVLLDLGLSSDQLAWTGRGFSFTQDGPLDMRFDPDEPRTAADLVNTLPERELADLIYEYGEERHSRRIAWRIVASRQADGPIETTGRLADLVRRSVPGKWGPIDPATRTFQALRIAVNRELEHLDAALAAIPDWLREDGRVAIIAFHSLEDRRVKHAFRDDPRLEPLSKKPITAAEDEVRRNPRARSAKLRVARKCPIPTTT